MCPGLRRSRPVSSMACAAVALLAVLLSFAAPCACGDAAATLFLGRGGQAHARRRLLEEGQALGKDLSFAAATQQEVHTDHTPLSLPSTLLTLNDTLSFLDEFFTVGDQHWIVNNSEAQPC